MPSISLAPSLILGFVSFLSSAFVLCRILLPILPPTPCSRRPPVKRVAPHIRRLCSADISHVWLSIFDALSLIVFLVQVFYQYQNDAPLFDAAKHGDSAACLWLALTARQTCLLIVLAITLLNVRLGRSTCFGAKNLYLWLSTVGIVGTGSIAAALLSIFGFNSLFGGIAVYLSVITVLTTGLLGFLVLTLSRIKRNLDRDRDAQRIDSWPIPPPRKRRTSVATDEVLAIKDGASWITSIEGSARRSLSPWSFSTSQANYPKSKHASRHSMPASFYSLTTGSVLSEINAMRQDAIPPVPPLPSPYRKLPAPIITETSTDDTPTSWLTSLSGTVKTMSPFSFPTTRAPSLRSFASRLTGMQKEGRQQPSTGTTAVFPVTFALNVPKRLPTAGALPLQSLALTLPPRNHIVTGPRVAMWLAIICLPFMFTMPYLILVRSNYDSPIPGILLAIGQAISSPLLALSMLFSIRLPVPSNLFDNKPKSVKQNCTATTTALPSHHCSTELRVRGKSGSYTVIDGQRCGDVWIQQGQAVDGLSKAGRVMSLLVPNPRLSVLPVHNTDNLFKVTESTKPKRSRFSHFRISQDEDVDEIALVPQRARPSYTTDSTPSLATQDGSPTSQFQVMTAQRYQPFPARILHFSRSRRASRGPPLSPPPTTPLPPTPDESLEEGRSLSPKLIDNLSAGMLPLLVPGLTVSDSHPITPYSGDRNTTPPSSSGSERSRESSKIEDLYTPIGAPHIPRRTQRTYSTMTSPDDQSTPRFEFPRRTRDDQSILPLSGKAMSHSGGPSHSTLAQVELQEISLVPEDDTLTQKLNSLIRSLGSPGTPSSSSNGVLFTKSPVKPLVPRRTEGVMRRKPKSQRYSPLKISRREIPSGIPRPRKQPKDSKSLYRHLPSRIVRAPAQKDASPEKPVSPTEYLPAINRLSAIITDYESNKKQDLSASKASFSMAARKPFGANPGTPNASHVGEFAQIEHRDGKENAPLRPSINITTLNRTDTAKHRSHLMQTQRLPTVVIRPPSGGSFQAFAPARAGSAWNEDII